MMKNGMKTNTWKIVLLICVMSLGLLLTSCYVPPDDLSGQGGQTGGKPIATVNVTQAPTATPVPTDVPEATVTLNWDNLSGDPTATPTGTYNPFAQNTIQVATVGPTATLKPTDTPAPGTATATPTSSVLKKGATGSEVKKVQQRLKELGYYAGKADGDFGAGTDAAVRAFQRANGLRVDGVVGAGTLKVLNSKDAKPAKTAATATPKKTNKPTATPKPTAKPTPKPTATPKVTVPSYAGKTYLELGASGTKVRDLQKRLIELGWMGGKADGEYGGATDYAVRAFQKKASGLWSDGVAGPDTLAALYSTNAPRSSSPVSSIGVTLEEGSTGGSVRALQQRLKALGYLSSTVDGSYGASTEAAVIAFQVRNGLKGDGKAGTGTLNKVYSQSALPSNGSPTDIGTGTTGSGISSTGYSTLREGNSGDSVKALQRKLKDKGFYSGNVDGNYGSSTVAAVKAFQSLNSLRVDGVAGPATQRILFGTSGASITYTSLSEGMTGEAVRTMQYTLYELGYYDGHIDGKYGDTTREAVMSFQDRNGLTPDGKAGNKTLQLLYSNNARSATKPTATFPTLRRGSKGESVLELKDQLMQYGYLKSDNGTNVYDADTEDAVRRFQERNGLTPDGVAGQETQEKLYSSHVKPAK